MLEVEDGTVFVWLDAVPLQELLCSEPGRNLDRVTWSKYLPDESWTATCVAWE